MVRNKALIFKAIPDGMPEAGKHLVVEDIGFDPSSAPANSAILKVFYASFDPYLRGKMRDSSVKSYSAPFELGAPLQNSIIGKVIMSSHSRLSEGDLVKTYGPIAEWMLLTAEQLEEPKEGQPPLVQILSNPHNVPILDFLGALGMPGITAYSSFYEIGRPQRGETIFISAASGAVGSLVGQLAKHQGLRVIGSVGDDEKLGYITSELGFDAGFNYKKEKPADALARLAPDGLDIYYDNVGGETFQAALEKLNNFGRVVCCGMISQYNLAPADKYRYGGLEAIFARRLKIQGFIQADPDFAPKYGKEHQEKVSKWIAEGSFVTKTHVTKGMDDAPEGLLDLFRGKNFGKAVLEVCPP